MFDDVMASDADGLYGGQRFDTSAIDEYADRLNAAAKAFSKTAGLEKDAERAMNAVQVFDDISTVLSTSLTGVDDNAIKQFDAAGKSIMQTLYN